ncbi:MAG TPA: lipocalin family protein [Flavobacterium sp.]|nr:lipocalin family protein [Flavobacterium sp.]
MKKLIFFLAVAVSLFGCKSPQSPTSTKLDNKTETMIKGNWTVTSVNYPGSDYIKVTSFQIADSKCFVGSTWKFVSVSNKGSMALNSGVDCAAYSSDIKWYINKDDQFVLKILDETKAKKVRDGFVLTFANRSDNSFQLIDKIDVGGKITNVVYQFQRK